MIEIRDLKKTRFRSEDRVAEWTVMFAKNRVGESRDSQGFSIYDAHEASWVNLKERKVKTIKFEPVIFVEESENK